MTFIPYALYSPFEINIIAADLISMILLYSALADKSSQRDSYVRGSILIVNKGVLYTVLFSGKCAITLKYLFYT